jgi:hypothetical protein
MKKIKRLTLFAIAAVAATCITGIAPAGQRRGPVIQMAILLDTSNSMDGLINQAKSQLWKIVNQFTEAEKCGRRPELQVALYEYGNNRLPATGGYIRRVLPLTTDLDAVSRELFALTTNGGSEYCGWVIGDAVSDLAWSASNDDLKVIFIAGNEPFTQGPRSYRGSVADALLRGITVNTIHCGSEQAGIDGEWRRGALLAEGHFLVIDQDKTILYTAAPQDERLAELGEKLNGTYIGYGDGGRAGAMNQAAQDKNALGESMDSAVNRAVFKSKGIYRNSAWDLVDALEYGERKISDLDPGDLPENMRGMSPQQQQSYIDGKRGERKRIQDEINRLNIERKAFLAEKMKETPEADTLDSAMIRSIRSLMVRKNFEIR